jgi:hypothetical protein
LKLEINWFLEKIGWLLDEYIVDQYNTSWRDFINPMLDAAFFDFPAINGKKIDIADITKEDVYNVSATYSVIGQIWRHRTLVKQYSAHTYKEEVEAAKICTTLYNYNEIGMHREVSELVKI